MALSNLRNEPRREITETVIGVLALGALVLLDYGFSLWFWGVTGAYRGGCPWPLGMIMGPLLLVLIGLALVWALRLAHCVGEFLCPLIEAVGIQVRPRRRK